MGKFFQAVALIVVIGVALVWTIEYLNRPIVVGIVYDDGTTACSYAYDASGPRDCVEVMKGRYEFIPVPPSKYKGPKGRTGR